MQYVSGYRSPFGGITLMSDGEYLTGLWFDGQKHFPTLTSAQTGDGVGVIAETVRWLDEYFAGKIPVSAPKTKPAGTDFQKLVWEILLTVPYGMTVTYGDIAKIVARKKGVAAMSAQAIGSAVAVNPVSLVIPCHRVIGSDGRLVGYAAGTDIKLRLLTLEKKTRAENAHERILSLSQKGKRL